MSDGEHIIRGVRFIRTDYPEDRQTDFLPVGIVDGGPSAPHIRLNDFYPDKSPEGKVEMLLEAWHALDSWIDHLKWRKSK